MNPPSSICIAGSAGDDGLGGWDVETGGPLTASESHAAASRICTSSSGRSLIGAMYDSL
jgi:hypothetical protein